MIAVSQYVVVAVKPICVWCAGASEVCPADRLTISYFLLLPVAATLTCGYAMARGHVSSGTILAAEADLICADMMAHRSNKQ